MDDYIRRADAIDALESMGWYHQAPNKEMVHGANSTEHQAWYKEEDVFYAIEAVPTADVMPVVRCRECIYWEPASPTRTSGNCNRSFDIPAWANDFCSYGKRKDGGHDD